MSLFKAAAAKTAAKPTTSKAKKSTTWLTGGENHKDVANAIHELTALDTQRKAIETKSGVFKAIILKHAKGLFYRDYAHAGVFPETPMVVQNQDGEKATFVVQDRSAQYKVKDDQKDALIDVLGEDAASEMLVEETSFSFDREIMLRDGVMELVDAALSAVQEQLLEANILAEGESLIGAETKTSFRPGTLDKLALICGKDTTKMAAVVSAMGSSATMYVKT